MTASTEQDPLAVRMAQCLRRIDGVVGVVLGGSQARGTHGPDSDYDIGVYYAGDEALAIHDLDAAARSLDDEHRDGLIVPPGGWGHWVNGGGWLTVDGQSVDILLRDIGRVEQAVADCLAGRVHAHYQTGHPHAYLNVMYAGELAIATILADDSGVLTALRARTHPYPEPLQKALYGQFGFEAGFSLTLARANLGRGDASYVAAHVIRSLSCLNQVLFAANRQYCINEKKAAPMLDSFPKTPPDYLRRVNAVVALLGNDDAAACEKLASLLRDSESLL